MPNSTELMGALSIIRPINLLFLFIVQAIIHYGLLVPGQADTSLDDLGFSLLVLATMLIAAGGYVLNDIQDMEVDKVNRAGTNPVGMGFGEKQANSLYIILTASGVVAGFILSHLVDRPVFATVFVGVAALLYGYSTYFNYKVLMGNILISLLVALGLIVVPVFDLVPTTDWSNRQWHTVLFRIVLLYAALAFVMNFIREIIKDVEDMDGDKAGGRLSLPMVLGSRLTKGLLMTMIGLLIAAVCVYLYLRLYNHTEVVVYFFVAVIAPLTYSGIQIGQAKTPSDYRKASRLIKLIMFTGMLGMLSYPLIIWK